MSGIADQMQEFLAQQIELYGDELALDSAIMTVNSAANSYTDDWKNSSDLDKLNAGICTCIKCPLGLTRNKFIFGVGNPHADIVLIGEAPGADEDRLGEPFVGRAGELLNKMLASISLERGAVYICNILKCRPPQNRDPLPEEMAVCKPYLLKQLALIKPRLILCLGRIAAQALLSTTESLTQLRNTWHPFEGAEMLATYHPAALLRNPQYKRDAWEDLKLFKQRSKEVMDRN
jgi:uracil-DNA glycosylase